MSSIMGDTSKYLQTCLRLEDTGLVNVWSTWWEMKKKFYSKRVLCPAFVYYFEELNMSNKPQFPSPGPPAALMKPQIEVWVFLTFHYDWLLESFTFPFNWSNDIDFLT